MTERGIELSCEKLCVRYDRQIALECDSLHLRGNCIAVVGHNGAGKSTLIKTVLDLLPRHSGSCSVVEESNGVRTRLLPHEHMAFCPETGAVFADISVESYVKLWCRIKHGRGNYYKREGAEILEMLSLAPLLKKLGRELSKGQRRRVQTAIGFLTAPRLFLFDEPFDGLDVQKSHELSEICSALASKMSFIISSHRMDVVECLADVVVVLKEGRIVVAGPLEQVCRDLCTRSVQISNLTEPARIAAELKSRFPTALVHRIGELVSVVGGDFSEADLHGVVRSIDRNGSRFASVKPSLVDAMNYHLRRIGK